MDKFSGPHAHLIYRALTSFWGMRLQAFVYASAAGSEMDLVVKFVYATAEYNKYSL